MSIFKSTGPIQENYTFNEYETQIFYDSDVTSELNQYRNSMPISLAIEPVLDFKHGDPKKGYLVEDPNKILNGKPLEGRHSIFNRSNALTNNTIAQVNLNAPLFDTPTIRETIRKRSDCSVKALIEASEAGQLGVANYNYSDFMFCTHLGKVSNNYMITLRRFPHPAGDHINYTLIDDDKSRTSAGYNAKEYNGHPPAIGTLVAWLGTPGNDMSAILKYDVNLPYEEMRAEIQTNTEANADSPGGGFLGGLMNLGNPSYGNAVYKGAAGESGIGLIAQALSPFGAESIMSAPSNTSWAYHRDETKAYGPVDAIAKTHIRSGAEKGGIKFEHNITLTFDYTLRAFDGINARSAMLDLIGNILSVTYTNATYWRGAIRGNGAAQSNAFANLPIFNMQAPPSLAGTFSAAVQSLSQIGSLFNNGNGIGSWNDFKNAAKNLLKGAFPVMLGGLLNKLGRPQKAGLNSLINFSPTGVWHLMIGNPKHPIMSMGNMILDNCSIEHYGPLGLDDFPTGLKITITLKHGMPRDNLTIEHMYMNGDFRIYQPIGNQGEEAWMRTEQLYSKTTKPAQVENSINNALPINFDELKGKAKELAKSAWGKSKDLASATVNKVKESSTLGRASDAVNQRLTKWWGSIDRPSILKTIKEAHLGSDPVSTKQTKQENKA